MLGVVGSNLTIFRLKPTPRQHVLKHRNTVAKRTQHVAPNNVAICCFGMLRSFGRGLRDFPQTKLDSEINAPSFLNGHGDPHSLFYKFNENNIINN